MILLLDIGNTHTHLGLADQHRVVRQKDMPTTDWAVDEGPHCVNQFIRKNRIEGVCLCSVVPAATSQIHQFVLRKFRQLPLELTAKNIRGIGINYPKPNTIGPDRLANAIAARHHFGYPSVVVDFGTAVTFDVVDGDGNYAGGIIAPGLSAMTTYLHEKTALLPAIKIKEIRTAIGKSTEDAMLIGAVHGYRGLIKELILEVSQELCTDKLPVVATGGYAALIAAGLKQIMTVEPNLTLEGLRLLWFLHHPSSPI